MLNKVVYNENKCYSHCAKSWMSILIFFVVRSGVVDVKKINQSKFEMNFDVKPFHRSTIEGKIVQVNSK